MAEMLHFLNENMAYMLHFVDEIKDLVWVDNINKHNMFF